MSLAGWLASRPESGVGGWAEVKGWQSITVGAGAAEAAPAALHALLVPDTFSFYDSLIIGPKRGPVGGWEEGGKGGWGK